MGKKRIFISDVHMGCDVSSAPRKPYVWFKKNAHLLAKFLGEQLMDHDVSEVVILGDLFDEWIIPADYPPITSFKSICSNSTNEPVITGLRALAADGRLVYVPGNHDMATTADGIAETKSFLEETDNFPGIRFVCDGNVPRGRLRWSFDRRARKSLLPFQCARYMDKSRRLFSLSRIFHFAHGCL